MPPGDQLRALAAAEKFIRTQITAVDLVSILRYSGRLRRRPAGLHRRPQSPAQHSRDHGRRRRSGLRRRQSTTPAPPTPAPPSARTTASSISSIPIASSPPCKPRRRCSGNINEKKALIYFASGLRLNGVDNQAQLHATIDAAVRAGVSFWPIDSRGLVAEAPLGDATPGLAGQRRHVFRHRGAGRHHQLPAVAGHPLRPRRRHRRQGPARQQRPHQRHRSGAEGHLRVLPPRSTTPPTPRWTESFAASRSPSTPIPPPSWITARATTQAKSSASSPSPTKSGNSKTPSCSKTPSPNSPSPWRSITSS